MFEILGTIITVIMVIFLIIVVIGEILLPKKERRPRPVWHQGPGKEEYAEMLREPEWLITRSRILDRDNHHCRLCNADHNLQVHHTSYHGYHPSDTPDEYLLTLCRHCHTQVHDGNNDYRLKANALADEAVEAAEAALDNAAIMGEEEARLEMERFQRELKDGIEKLRAKHAQSNPN